MTTSKTSDINDKIAHLESLLAHQDHAIQELSDIVISQGNDIDALKKYIKMTKEKLQELENNIGDKNNMSPTEEAAANKPPHY